jgi:adenylate kinase
VLDTDAGLFEISTDVMRRLDPVGFIHLEDQAERILERRTRDTKKRPARTVDQLHAYQERSRATCRAYDAALGKWMLEVRSGDTEGFLNAIRALLAGDSRQSRKSFVSSGP